MGSWNETCGLTHLPILPGDTVYGLILTMPPSDIHLPYARAHAGVGLYSPTDLWENASPLFACEYADYGHVRAEDEAEEALRKAIFQAVGGRVITSARLAACTGEPDEMAEHDGDAAGSCVDFLSTLRLIERGRAFWASLRIGVTVASPFGLWFAHTWAVDAAIGPHDDVSGKAFLDAEAGWEKAAAKGGEALYAYERALPHYLTNGARITPYYGRNVFVLPPEGDPGIARAQARTEALLDAMREARMALHPQSGKGSQGDSRQVQMRLAAAITQHSRPSFDDGEEPED